MKLIKIEGKLRDYFLGLDPFGYMDKKYGIPGFTLGAAEESDDGDIPVGLICCCLKAATVIITWLYVDPAYRGQGVGEKLLSAVMDASHAAKKPSVAAALISDPGWEKLCPDQEAYFTYQGFDRRVESQRDKRIYLFADLFNNSTGAMGVLDELVAKIEATEEIEEGYRMPGIPSMTDTWDINGIMES